ncbi:MAG: hypothetical protein MRJ65_05640 [Candidatus Brocadiaceae bacterium]|nr:hypothetical protein [Candidatus Brocadiaceae bacterium]
MCMEKGCYLPPGVYYFQDENSCTYDNLLREWESLEPAKNTVTSPFALSETKGKKYQIV